MAHAAQKSCTYQRRRPELTPCYRILQEHLATFVADRDAESLPLPKHVLDEFDAYMRCGILAHGFIRLVCDPCQKELVVAFSCKRRGFCPSCCAKRMAEAATHLTENVLPLAPYRQFVLSFPIPMRHWLNNNRGFAAQVYGIVTKAIHRHYQKKAESLGSKNAVAGTIAFLQRAGSALTLNPHLHILALDGTYTLVNDMPKLRCAPKLEDSDVENLLGDIVRRVTKLCRRRGYLDNDGTIVNHPELDPLFAPDGPEGQMSAVARATASSLQGKIAFGPNAGKRVRRIGGGFGYEEEIPLAKSYLCYAMNGFSLHARTAVNTHARERLYQLIEYMARGPLSNERLEILPNGDVKLTLKTAWQNGVTHLVHTPSEFIERLVAIIPPPRSHLVRWAGVFASNSAYRKIIAPNPKVKKGFQFEEEQAPGPAGSRPLERKFKNYTWSKMLAKVFKIDTTVCPHCRGPLQKIAAIVDPQQVRRYLKHVGLGYEAPARAPPRIVQGSFNYQDEVSPEQYNADEPT